MKILLLFKSEINVNFVTLLVAEPVDPDGGRFGSAAGSA